MPEINNLFPEWLDENKSGSIGTPARRQPPAPLAPENFDFVADKLIIEFQGVAMAKFQAGQSGNPGGRPSGLGEIREIARQHTDTAIETLVKVMNTLDASPSARVAAASALLDRGWGRPEQSLKASIQDETGFSELLREISERRQAELVSLPKLVSSEQA